MGLSQSSDSVGIKGLSWDVTTSPKNISINTPSGTKKVVIYCPIYGSPSKQIKLSYNEFLSFDLVTKKIYNVYKSYDGKIDGVFFEGLELIEVKDKTAYYQLILGS